MGEIADALLNGDDCEVCGEHLGPGDGFPRRCAGCRRDVSDSRPRSKYRAYVVFHGRQTGIFNTWQEAEPHVKGFKKGITYLTPSPDR